VGQGKSTARTIKANPGLIRGLARSTGKDRKVREIYEVHVRAAKWGKRRPIRRTRKVVPET